MSPERSLQTEAPAKVNLALHVTGRRADGYHLLDTLAVFTGAADIVATLPGRPRSLRIHGPFAATVGTGPDNLVLRAAALAAASPSAGPAFALTKNLPVAAGLGGGSADAAATLRLLDAARLLPLSPGALADAALALGADVPMCLRSLPLRARGIGEEIDPLPDFPSLDVVLVNPGVAVPTGSVFAGLEGRFGPPLPDPSGLRDAAGVVGYLAATGNHLEAPAAAAAPPIGEVLARLRADPDCRLARMSGSGATCFAICEDAAAARAMASRIEAAEPGWWVVATRTRRTPPEVRTAG